MKIKISPCFWCGHKSTMRVVSDEKQAFNACESHGDHLARHAQLLFPKYSWYTSDGLSSRFTWDDTTEAFTEGAR